MRSSPLTRRVRCPFRPLLVELEGRVVPSFVAPLAFDAGARPRSVAVGDFNGDGAPDLAVANDGSANVSVLLGTGDGAFQTTHVSYVAGGNPHSVAVEDFNGDGWPDLAVANEGSNDVSILDNDGAWTRPGPAPSGGRAPSLPDLFALGDLGSPRAVTPGPQSMPPPVKLPLPAYQDERPTPAPLPAAARAEVTPRRLLDDLFAALSEDNDRTPLPSWEARA